MQILERIAIIALLVREAGNVGRTALMKSLYFLQTVHEMPLGYHFAIYSYGPFDSDVLSDLAYAVRLDAVSEDMVRYFNGGYGYQIRSSKSADDVIDRINLDSRSRAQIAEIAKRYAQLPAATLELESTIIFVDRQAGQQTALSVGEIVERVSKLKPHFGSHEISEHTRTLLGEGILTSVVER